MPYDIMARGVVPLPIPRAPIATLHRKRSDVRARVHVRVPRVDRHDVRLDVGHEGRVLLVDAGRGKCTNISIVGRCMCAHQPQSSRLSADASAKYDEQTRGVLERCIIDINTLGGDGSRRLANGQMAISTSQNCCRPRGAPKQLQHLPRNYQRRPATQGGQAGTTGERGAHVEGGTRRGGIGVHREEGGEVDRRAEGVCLDGRPAEK